MAIGAEGDMDTKEQARKLIPLLQAYVDGKTLQKIMYAGRGSGYGDGYGFGFGYGDGRQ